MANILSKPLALITTTTVSVLSLFAAAAASVSLSTRPGLRKARLALHLGVYVGTLAVCSCLGVVYSVVLSLIGQVSCWHTSADKETVADAVLPMVAPQHQLPDRPIILLPLLTTGRRQDRSRRTRVLG
jgi:hypothetical protein